MSLYRHLLTTTHTSNIQFFHGNTLSKQIDLLPTDLLHTCSSVGTALHQHSRDHGFKSCRSCLNFPGVHKVTIAYIVQFSERIPSIFPIIMIMIMIMCPKSQQYHAGSSGASCNKQPQKSKTCLRIQAEPNSTVFCIISIIVVVVVVAIIIIIILLNIIIIIIIIIISSSSSFKYASFHMYIILFIDSFITGTLEPTK